MADQFRVQGAITFVQQTPPETFRLMDVTINNIAVAYEHGKLLAVSSATDLKIAEDVNVFVMNCNTGVSVKFGTTTNPALENVTHLSYKGSKTTVYVTNNETEDISINYATCSL